MKRLTPLPPKIFLEMKGGVKKIANKLNAVGLHCCRRFNHVMKDFFVKGLSGIK